MKVGAFAKVTSLKISACSTGLKISTIYSLYLKIKFLDKPYNAYFSIKFQTKIAYYEKKLSLFGCLLHD
jgi:hypothetical protein